jgi:hypothetical protein
MTDTRNDRPIALETKSHEYDEHEKNSWLKSVYMPQLASLLDSNMSYLHTTLNWAVTVLLGGIVFVATRPTFPDGLGLVGLEILFVVLGHFAVRTAKAYLNVIRWSSLEKHILGAIINDADQAGWKTIKGKILSYHYEWKSPLTARDIAQKVLLELGFFYFFAVVLALIIYAAHSVGIGVEVVISFIVTSALFVLEISIGLLRSNYMRTIEGDVLARSNR